MLSNLLAAWLLVEHVAYDPLLEVPLSEEGNVASDHLAALVVHELLLEGTGLHEKGLRVEHHLVPLWLWGHWGGLARVVWRKARCD
eukprot:CAMPEP_0206272042 /NCGR_PEP_ID=MMETSP0047_2-20121206/33779_1 /ASSEMBLY_ACC=CAM_ASM_000192 /TAXON_ID=195065 /ORGANISM="Chroomonas mesostigmatica_cf, Strain CCMP1168" /LENGTH=85 /DNA_ID=CAMNT_0053700901 /DNA_START=177 /DNA_END=431 /DNA_ORIENTATION=+